MVSRGEIERAFEIYWADLRRAEAGGAHWAMLHVVLCLPDICAALSSSDGKTRGERYCRWCNAYLPQSLLNGEERWQMRNKVLHQGHAIVQRRSRYERFVYGYSTDRRRPDHLRVDGESLQLDVGELAAETMRGVSRWAADVERNSNGQSAQTVARNLESLVRVQVIEIPFTCDSPVDAPLTTVVLKTN
jgi:hypothetical protein